MSNASEATTFAPRILLGTFLTILGIPLITMGFDLIDVGGSYYYLIFGASLLITAILVFRRDKRALYVYTTALIYSVIWALLETEGTLWGLQARLSLPIALSIWVLWPWVKALPKKLSITILGSAIACFVYWLYAANSVTTTPFSAPDDADKTMVQQDWSHYGNDVGGSKHSPLSQIHPGNVSDLSVAWTYSTGAEHFGNGLQVTPLMKNNVVYLCTADNQVHSIDAETGELIWKYDPKVDAPGASACRGVAYFEANRLEESCSQTIIFATADARLMALDATTGEPCANFGENGTVDLKRGMGEVLRGYYYVSSAPTIVRGKVVVGGWVMDNQSVNEPSGVIRAYDAGTGTFAWAWDMDKPHNHEEPAVDETYSRGTANSWAPMSGDDDLGLVYVPTGNATPDYWGAHRSPGSEKYSSSVVAIDVDSGEAVWHFQTTHHDLWDYDVGSQPTLIDIELDGEKIPALIQPTKRGETFLLDRRTGTPLAAVEERPVPQGASDGDYTSPTQPFSVGLPAFDRTYWTEEMMWGAFVFDQLWCRIKFKEARYEGAMTPPNTDPSLYYPSYLGGNGWGGVSVDPDRGLMFSNWNRMLNWVRLVPREEAGNIEASKDGGVHIGQPVPQIGTPFASDIKPFMSPLGMPCNEPPFGMLTAVDLNTRKVLWEKPLGTSKDSGPLGLRTFIPLPVGVPNQGGSMTTASGLLFIGASQERVFRAFEADTGRLLWKADLPAGGNAGPMSYIGATSGRQFVVIAAGGNAPLSSGRSDKIVAFAIPIKP